MLSAAITLTKPERAALIADDAGALEHDERAEALPDHRRAGTWSAGPAATDACGWCRHAATSKPYGPRNHQYFSDSARI